MYFFFYSPPACDWDGRNNPPKYSAAQSQTNKTSDKAGNQPTHAADDERDMSYILAKGVKYLPIVHWLVQPAMDQPV